MGCAGNEEIRSPNLDRLAREGIRFDNFFCTSPVCSPARASILTGRIPSQHGMHDFVSMPHDREGQPNPDIPANSIHFLSGTPSYADLLAEIGYDTCLSGKWHLGGYFASIEEMDRNVGRLLDWLESRDLRSNTLVVFMGDNGMNMGHHGIYGKGNDVAKDPNERVNLFIQPGYADRIRTLRREMEDWFSRYVDPELDGSRLPVTGYGQRDHATKADAFDYRPRN